MKKRAFLPGVLVGLICGITISGTVAIAATGVLANPTTSRVLVDGQEVKVSAYNIGGNNYFKLRDIGAAVDFGVEWDGPNNTIKIDTTTGYTPEATPATPAPTQSTSGPYTVFSNPPVSVMTKKGDTIQTDTGPYAITKGKTERVTETAGLAFPYGGEPALPSVGANWASIYPDLEHPSIIKRFTGTDEHGAYDQLSVYNAYETERMILTLYRAVENNPRYFQNGKPLLNITIELTEGMSYSPIYPYRESEITKQIDAGAGNISVYASDVYFKGVFQYTYYYIG